MDAALNLWRDVALVRSDLLEELEQNLHRLGERMALTATQQSAALAGHRHDQWLQWKGVGS